MTTMNVSLPDSLKEFVDQQVDKGGYSTSSEYVRNLIRRDQITQGERELAQLLREGIESGVAQPIDQGYWDRKKAKLRKRA